MTVLQLAPRTVRSIGLLLLLTGCGGGGDPITPVVAPPVVTQPGPPASLTLVSGDAQSATIGSVLPVKLSVLVKDAAGTALAGIAVQFSVDSGGGVLATTAASTGSNGVAVAGDWTLGSAAGAQVVSARVSALSPVKFRAQAIGPLPQILFDKVPVGTSGGTLVYRRTGDPLDGLQIVVPSGAYPTSTPWTIVADSTIKVPLPADFTQVGPVLVINNTQGYADSVMTLTMPMPLPDDVAIVPFYYDSASNTLEGIPLVDRSPTTVTLATRHFSRDLLGLPGNVSETSALRTAMALGFGAVKIVWVKAPKLKLIGTFNSTFRPAVDNWEFVNNGEYISPGGICEGMSISAMYYHFFQKLGGKPPLYRQFDLTLANVLDNVQGIRFSGSVQGDYSARFKKGINQLRRLIDLGVANGTKVEDLTSTWILMTLKLSSRPVLLAIQNADAGHAVVAYAATFNGVRTNVSFADPNYPEISRTMVFESGRLTPVSMSVKAGKPDEFYDKAYALSVTAEVPLVEIDARFAEFKQQKAGADRYPASYRAEYYDNLTESWLPLPSTLLTTDAQLELRHICTSCPTKTTGTPPEMHRVELWDGTGENSLGSDGLTTNNEGTTKYYAVLSAYTASDPSSLGFVDAIPFTVVYRPFTIDDPPLNSTLGDVVTVTANAGNLAPAGSTFTWTVDDDTPAVTGTSKTFTHTYLKVGQNRVRVTLKDDKGKVIARASKIVFIGVKVTITQSPGNATPGSPVTFTAVVQGVIRPVDAPSVRYSWSIEGPSPSVDVTGPSPSIQHTFPTGGTYNVILGVSIIAANGESLSLGFVDEFPVVLSSPPMWRLDQFTITQRTCPGACSEVSFSPFEQLAITPGEGVIFAFPLGVTPSLGVLYPTPGVYLSVAPRGQGASLTKWSPTTAFFTESFGNTITSQQCGGRTVQNAFSWTGTSSTGTVSGASSPINQNRASYRYTIQATKTGNTMAGTITMEERTCPSDAIFFAYTATFRGQLMP
ncbi:MAG: PKD domain-containing protein [Gemmatimonadaceae bacterium]|nr:PKD domain-containing protein [Gemmatimonadaceae bacterium]